MSEYKIYEVTLTLKCKQSPRKWVPDVINESLIMDEKLLDWDIDYIDESNTRSYEVVETN
tara:strand:+ start:350 stop:529 length:180 start_codon:yes stop_codon:yes gene_type:complete